MRSDRKKLVKIGLKGKSLKASHDRTEDMLGASHQNDSDKRQEDLAKGQAALDKSRAEIMRQVVEHDKLQRAQDKAQDTHDQRRKEEKVERKSLRKAHQDIQDEDASLPLDEENKEDKA